MRAIGVIIYDEKLDNPANNKNQYKVSLRSIGDEDVSVIAKLFGGGGHKNAGIHTGPYVFLSLILTLFSM